MTMLLQHFIHKCNDNSSLNHSQHNNEATDEGVSDLVARNSTNVLVARWMSSKVSMSGRSLSVSTVRGSVSLGTFCPTTPP